jgi:hypothetical protein
MSGHKQAHVDKYDDAFLNLLVEGIVASEEHGMITTFSYF